ncbi:4467_t:CDS:2 [Entrophospora sp. SA101]|nr:4467_t:CDS:2 [Entrophospora sp. SA101]
MESVNEFTYENIFWPKISNFIQNALQVELQIKRPLHTYSHEELYRSIYWICWQGFQKRLYKDLKSVIEDTLEFLNNQLIGYKQLDDKWFQKFAEISINYARAVEILSSMFSYLVSKEKKNNRTKPLYNLYFMKI